MEERDGPKKCCDSNKEDGLKMTICVSMEALLDTTLKLEHKLKGLEN